MLSVLSVSLKRWDCGSPFHAGFLQTNVCLYYPNTEWVCECILNSAKSNIVHLDPSSVQACLQWLKHALSSMKPEVQGKQITGPSTTPP